MRGIRVLGVPLLLKYLSLGVQRGLRVDGGAEAVNRFLCGTQIHWYQAASRELITVALIQFRQSQHTIKVCLAILWKSMHGFFQETLTLFV